MRAQTKPWTQKDGTKIRICDMSDSHLVNTLALMKRFERYKTDCIVDEGFAVLTTLRGEMAIDSVEKDLDRLMDYGLEPREVHPLYCNLLKEKGRREVKAMTEKFKQQFYVAGVKFRPEWKENLKTLTEGMKLNLNPEPTNKFDKDAVIVDAYLPDGPVMLGYVPAKTGEAKVVSQLLRDGKELQANLIELQPDFEPWNALLVEVEEV